MEEDDAEIIEDVPQRRVRVAPIAPFPSEIAPLPGIRALRLYVGIPVCAWAAFSKELPAFVRLSAGVFGFLEAVRLSQETHA